MKKPTKPRNTLETLKAVRRLLTRERWIKGELYVLSNGAPLLDDSGKPVGVCLLGACDYVDGRFEDSAVRIIKSLLPPEFDRCVSDFNDHSDTTYEHVRKLLNRAVAKAARRT